MSKKAELLVLRHENAVLRRHMEKVRYQPEDRLWFAALSGLIPRRRWAEVFDDVPRSRSRRGRFRGGPQLDRMRGPSASSAWSDPQIQSTLRNDDVCRSPMPRSIPTYERPTSFRSQS